MIRSFFLLYEIEICHSVPYMNMCHLRLLVQIFRETVSRWFGVKWLRESCVIVQVFLMLVLERATVPLLVLISTLLVSYRSFVKGFKMTFL